MCDVHCTVQIDYSWDSLGINSAVCAIICHITSGGVQHCYVRVGETI